MVWQRQPKRCHMGFVHEHIEARQGQPHCCAQREYWTRKGEKLWEEKLGSGGLLQEGGCGSYEFSVRRILPSALRPARVLQERGERVVFPPRTSWPVMAWASPWRSTLPGWWGDMAQKLNSSWLLFLLQVELAMTYGCELPQERLLQYIHFNRYHNTMMINKLRDDMTRHLHRCTYPWTKLSTGCYM